MTKLIIGLGILSCALYYCVYTNVRMFFVITGSMKPPIPASSLIISKKISYDQVKAGKVIIFNDQNTKRVTAHRVVENKEGNYVTKGDANEYQDRLVVHPVDMIGEVMGVFPLGDFVTVGLQVVFLALALILGMLLKQFLLFLKHGISHSTTTYNALCRFYLFRCAKKVVCGGRAGFSPG